MPKTKKVKSTGRFGAGYGKKPRERFIKIEEKQRKKQICPFCKNKTAKTGKQKEIFSQKLNLLKWRRE